MTICSIPCSWAKFGQNLQLSIQNVHLGDADHKSGWYGTMEHQGEENRMGSMRIGWKYRSKPQTHFTHILFIGLAQYNEERS